MKLKVEHSYQMIGEIYDADGQAISIVQNASTKKPFKHLKSEDGIEWGQMDEEEKSTELKALTALTHNVAPTSIKFPEGVSKEEVEDYMTKFEDGSYNITAKDGKFIVLSKYGKPDDSSRDVILPSGIVYTLNKFNISDTMKSYTKEINEMSKEKPKDNKKDEAQADSIESIKGELIATLKALSTEDMTAVLDEVLPKEESKSEEPAKEEGSADEKADETDETVDAEPKDEGDKEDETSNEDEKDKEEKSESVSELKDLISALSKEVAATVSKNAELAKTVTELTSKLSGLEDNHKAHKDELEKSLKQEEVAEIIAEMVESIDTLSAKVESLEFTPANSDSSKIEKSEEVYNKGSGFLKKFL